MANSNGKEKEEKKSEKKAIDYDTLLSAAGEFGLYQWLLFISTFPFYWFGVFSYFAQLFMTEVSPNHWCWIPELENLTEIERRSLAVPLDESSRFGYSQCSAYIANWSEVISTNQKPNTTWKVQPCQNGWEFNKSEIPYPTISSEMGWVCEKDSYQATAQSIFFVGSVVGGFIIGWVADRFGRLPAAVISNLIGCVAGILSVFVQNFVQFSICRFFVGMSYDNCMMMVYLLVLEYVAPKYRSIIANMPFALFFTSGLVSLPWIAKACGHWKTISLATSIPMALSLLAPLILPESPRWLLSKGRTEDAVSKVVKIGQMNKKYVPADLIENFKQSVSNQTESNESILKLLKRPLLRRMLICMCLEYMSCFIVYDTLVRSIGQLQFDFFMSFTVVSVTELPSLVIISFVLDVSGRKFMSIVTLLISCVFSVLTAFVANGLPSVICAVLARFAVNMACNTAMQWAAEMFPTPVRGSAVSLVHICGYLATVISPFIAYLEVYYVWLPLVIAGIIAIFGVFILLGLPETANIDLPQTFEDAEYLITSQKMFMFPHKIKTTERKGHANESFEM